MVFLIAILILALAILILCGGPGRKNTWMIVPGLIIAIGILGTLFIIIKVLFFLLPYILIITIIVGTAYFCFRRYF
jgi:hypothetical protein